MMNYKLRRLIRNRGMIVSLSFNIILITLVIFTLVINFGRSNEQSGSDYVILGNVRDVSKEDITEIGNLNSCDIGKENYLFLGDSITYRYHLDKYFPDIPIVNSGIDGNKASDILEDMERRVYQYNPTTIFLLIGTNQLDGSQTDDEIVGEIQQIVEQIQKNRPYASIYIESIYPVNKNIRHNDVKWRENSRIININKMIEEYSKKHKVFYIDVYSSLIDDDGDLRKEYTLDGLHLSDEGYEVVTNILKKYIKEC